MQSPSQNQPVRLALVGAGIFARDAHVPSILRLGDRFEIVAIYSRTHATAAALAEQIPYPVDLYTDLPELLARDDIEAVDVLLPIAVMHTVLPQIWAAHKHVISEKPIAPDVAIGQTLLATYAHYPQLVWMVGENWRYEEAFLQAASLMRGGAIGRPIACHWAIYSPVDPNSKYYHSAWRRDSSFPGGYLLDGGVHHVSAMRMILGEIGEVSAVTTQVLPDLPPADTITATLRFDSGVLGTYMATYATRAPWPPLLHIAGETGSLRVQRREIEITQGKETRQIQCSGFDGVQKELAAFAESIRTGQPHLATPIEALQDLAVVEAMLCAAEERRTVVPERFV
jgi:predicted dehydrogenase